MLINSVRSLTATFQFDREELEPKQFILRAVEVKIEDTTPDVINEADSMPLNGSP